MRKASRNRIVVGLATTVSDCPSERPLPRTIAGVIEVGRQSNWEMIDLARLLFKIPGSLRLDGLISCLGERDRAVALRLHEQVPRGVHIDAEHLSETLPGVGRDGAAGGRRCAAYMLERGFRNFAIIGFKPVVCNPVLLVFEDCVREAGAECARIHALEIGPHGLDHMQAYFTSQIDKLRLPLAIFCANDWLAARVCDWCTEALLAVPEQVAILGTGNDILSCECSPVPISSLDWQCEHRGAEAARLLRRMMDGAPTPDGCLRVPPGGVVTRRSTDILAIPDPAIARALRYIWDYYVENIGAPEVARACGLSRRTLDRRFVAMIGRSVSAEIKRRRLQIACELLSTTDLKCSDVAARAGFGSTQYFDRRFEFEFGLTPLRYRQRERVHVKGATHDGSLVSSSGS